MAGSVVRPDSATGLRAKEFEQEGLQAFDALHLACAEKGADVFLTVDDGLLKRALKIADLKIPVGNPLKWLTEVLP
uniref:hypothetical protein n=1 Tax=Candidatus Electrothrix sp. TaxID=2170559 RepID=UPI004057AA44